jgi:hypothetical protein
MRITTLFCAALLLAAPFSSGHAQAVWKWKDERGVTHYSDQPGPNAVRVDLSSQTYSSDDARTDIQTDSRPRQRAAAVEYTVLQITQPTADQTIFAAEGPVTAQVQLEPGLQSGHRLQVLLDGQNISGEDSSSLSYILPQLDRGTHSLQAKVVDGNGETVVSSTPILFHMRQPTVRK